MVISNVFVADKATKLLSLRNTKIIKHNNFYHFWCMNLLNIYIIANSLCVVSLCFFCVVAAAAAAVVC